MEKAPHSICELIGRFGRVSDFAMAIGCSYGAAIKMRDRGAIAPRHWQKVVDASQERGIAGIDLEWLTARYEHGLKEAA